MHLYLTSWDSISSSLRTNLWFSLIPGYRNVQILAEAQVCILCFNEGGPIDHCTYVPVPVSQSSAESEYNMIFTAVMALANFIMLNIELVNKDPYVVLEQAHLVILGSKSDMCVSKNGKDTKHTRHISRRVKFVRNCEECNMYKTVWCEGGIQLAYIGTKNFRGD